MAKLRNTREAVNTDQISAAEARIIRSGSGKEVGHQSPDAGKLGTGTKCPTRSIAPLSPADPRRSVGGQATLTLFGCGPSITGKPIRAFKEVADDQARKVFGLTFGQRRARLGASIAEVAARFAHVERAPLPFAPSMETLMVLARAQIQREKEEAARAPKATPAMLKAAAVSDMREAFPFYHDEEPWERDTLFGHADLALAQD